ncbi:IclR family transcriptional regulator [Polaromonas sp. AER18D-145]|uniref:IclR family transcriptional regulator n=1 Tax=Polaromonas sp. AER18D-145 TaxID=1977060 RepID=UPI000BBBD362|nr:IclR family transcriptional regulator [Polaromonas sp. AER18D-145]
MSLTRVLRLLQLLADQPLGMALASLCVSMNAPKTSVLSLLRGLTAHGYLQRSDAVYRLGPESFSLGASLVSASSLDVVAMPFLSEAVARSGETALIAKINRAAGQLIYSPIIESTKRIRYAVPAGTTRPLFASSAGRVLLAFQDDAWRDEYLQSTDLRAMTPRSVTDRKQLARIIEQVRKTGVAVTIGEVTPDVAGFSAPIFEPGGRVNAALIIAAPIERGRVAAADLQRLVMELAANISRALGYRPEPDPRELAARDHKEPNNNLTRRLSP